MSKKIAGLSSLVLVFALIFSFKTWAEDKPEPRLITVTGDADIKVVPDKVVINLAVDTDNMDINLAKSQNDAEVKKVLSIANKYKIDPKDVQTSQINIWPDYDYAYSGRTFKGYSVNKSIAITLKDLSKFEDFITDLLKAGANRLYGIDFKTSELRKYRDQARSKAIIAAKEKAIALAAELGQKVGRPYSIKEGGAEERLYNPWRQNIQAQNISLDAGGASGPDEQSSLAPGQITINAKITVSFELE